MKIKFFFIAVLALVLSSCSNDDDEMIIPVPTPASNGFTWTKNGGSTVETAASASFSTQYKTLIAKDATDATVFEINLNGTVAATYTIGANNAVTFTGVNPFYAATGGTVIVTSNANGKMSGSFQTTGNAGGITAMNGTFRNIDVNP